MVFFDLVQKSRSFRAFDSSCAVTKEELSALVAHARVAPSSGNKQPIRYRLCYRKEEMAALLPHLRWAAALPDRHFPPAGKEPTAAIVLCRDLSVSTADTSVLWDGGIAAQTLLLAAAERGLGGCMIGSFHKENVSEALSLPAAVVPILVVALGKPTDEVRLETVHAGECTAYYRDEAFVHHVPKVALSDLIIE